MRLLRAELHKVWAKRAVMVALVFLLLANVFLLWVSTRPSPQDPPASAYKLLTQELRSLTMPQRVEYIAQHHKVAEHMVIVENVLTWEAQDSAMGQILREEYAAVMEEYEPLYRAGGFLTFTPTVQQEYMFLNIIRQELDTACNYEEFLLAIEQKAQQLSQISVFAEAGGYDHLNIMVTAAAFDGMSGISIDYLPQKGIHTAVNFQFTDVFSFFAMLVFATVLVRQERDSSLLGLIRSTAAGRTKTAVAKLAALAVSLLGFLLLLYGSNFVFCTFSYGLGNLGRSIQSLPFLMRSTLKLSVLQYSILFLLIKWACSFVAGAWVLLAAVYTKRALPGYLLASLLPACSAAVYWAMPATGKWNVLKYANLAGLMQTNHILGSYHNLYWFGRPIPLWLVSMIVACTLSGLFIAAFCWLFQFARLLPAPKYRTFMSALLSKFRKRRFSHRIFAYEAYKALLMNGVVWAFGILFVFQLVTAHQNPAYIGPEEIYYRYYMSRLEGPLTHEKYQWLSAEGEKFTPMFQLQQQLARGDISIQEYESFRAMYRGLEMEYPVYLRVVEHYRFVRGNPPAEFVYDTGYPELFGLQHDVDMKELAMCTLAVILCCSGMIAIENSTGMNRIINCTPLGRRVSIQKKIVLALLFSAIIALHSVLPKLYKAGVGYGLGGLMAPLFSLNEYRNAPTFLPIAALLLLGLLSRFLACFGLSVAVLSLSARTGNSTTTLFTSLITFCISPLLYFIGFESFKWLSAYPLFHLPAYMQSPQTMMLTLFYIGAWLLWTCVGVSYLYRAWVVD